MSSVSLQIMAHPRRASFVEELQEKLQLGAEHVTWDRRNDRWDTGRRAWLDALHRGADWVAVIQDDAIPCVDLVPGLTRALDTLDRKTLVCSYFGRAAHPQSTGLARLITHVGEQALTRNPSWITGFLMHGVLLAAPAREVKPMIRWCDKQSWPEYDKRVGKYFQKVKKHRIRYTWPSLVDHRDTGSLVGHAAGRTVWNFVGEDASALELDWSRGTVKFPPIDQFRDRASR